jgi:3-oxoacyl-[acyl-carrier-protein] synthase III
MKSVITGVGHYEPQRTITNEDIVKIYQEKLFTSKTSEEIIKTCKKA